MIISRVPPFVVGDPPVPFLMNTPSPAAGSLLSPGLKSFRAAAASAAFSH